jgi:hypothetical protein
VLDCSAERSSWITLPCDPALRSGAGRRPEPTRARCGALSTVFHAGGPPTAREAVGRAGRLGYDSGSRPFSCCPARRRSGSPGSRCRLPRASSASQWRGLRRSSRSTREGATESAVDFRSKL